MQAVCRARWWHTHLCLAIPCFVCRSGLASLAVAWGSRWLVPVALCLDPTLHVPMYVSRCIIGRTCNTGSISHSMWLEDALAGSQSQSSSHTNEGIIRSATSHIDLYGLVSRVWMASHAGCLGKTSNEWKADRTSEVSACFIGPVWCRAVASVWDGHYKWVRFHTQKLINYFWIKLVKLYV